MKEINIRRIFMLLCMFGLFAAVASAQPKAKKAAKKAIVEISSQVVGENGAPVSNALVTAGEGAVVRYTDAQGRFTVSAKEGTVVLVEAPGYKDYIIDLRVGKAPETVRMEAEPFLSGEKDMIDRADGGYISQHDLTAAIDRVNVENLRAYPDLTLTNALQGQAAGLIVRSNDGGLGNNGSSIYVRGLHAGSTNAIVVIDGIERPLGDISAEEIGSIEVLKDAPAKILYGPRAANGVLLVTTRRGEANKRIIKVNGEYGVSLATRLPQYLDSYNYATLYNEARANDGLSPRYTPEDLEGYRNSKGANDLYYPNVDWRALFTRNWGTYRKAGVEFNGGSDAVRYAVVAGYTGGSGMEVYNTSGLNRLNLRGNLDIVITDFLTVVTDVAARFEQRNWGKLDSGALYGNTATYRPNEYPLMMNAEDIGLAPNEDGSPYYGGSVAVPQNLYVDAVLGGHKSERYANIQSDFGFKFDMDRYVKGLFFDAYITFDNYNYVSEAMTRTESTYAVIGYQDGAGNQQNRVTQVLSVNKNDDIKVSGESTTRTWGVRGDLGYSRSFGSHDFSAISAFRYYRDEVLGANQDHINSMWSNRFNYSYGRKYLAELILGVMGSNQRSDRHLLFTPTLSLGWVMSNEDFMKGAAAVDFLKLKASAGRLGFYNNAGYLMNLTTWVTDGNYAHGKTNDTKFPLVALQNWASPNLRWVTSTEFNVGAEGLFFGSRLGGEINYFQELRDGQTSGAGTLYSAIIGSYNPTINYGRVFNHGVDLSLSWKDTACGGDLVYSFRAGYIWSKNKVLVTNEVENIEPWRSSVGQPTSTITGLVAEGLFRNEAQVGSHAQQGFGYYTVGDIAYKDLNDDGLIDSRDNRNLAQSFPLHVVSGEFRINWKGLGLYALGTGEAGHYRLINNGYFRPNALTAYSVKALDRWHPVNNPDGTMPRLSTTTASNNSQASTFWLRNAGWLRLKNVELSYTFTNYKAKGPVKAAKVFARGSNLFVIQMTRSDLGLDPERIDAGVGNYPVCRMVTGGVSLTF